MKNQKISMRLVCAFLVLALACTCGFVPRADAAVSSLNPEKECSITVTTPNDMPEMKDLSFNVKLYRFASVDANVNYTVVEAFKGFDGIPADMNEVKSYKTDNLMKLAEAVASVAEKKTPDAVLAMSGGKGTAFGLSAGFWLVVPETVESAVKKYVSVPFVVALPNLEKDESFVEDWNYDITAVLKPETEDLFGPIEIIKDLLSCNTSLSGADVVFSVTADKDYPTGEGGKTKTERVYSNLISLHFAAPGVKSYRIDNLPLGSVVTVTEVYDGGAYRLVNTQQVQTDTVDDPVEPARFYFENEYNDGQTQSVSVLNHFVYAGSSGGEDLFNHSKLNDSTEEAR